MLSLLQDYVDDTSRWGPPIDGSYDGSAGGAACGDLVRISLLVDAGVVGKVTFDTKGCAATRAAAACLAETVEGMSVIEAATIDQGRIEDTLGGLSPARHHAVVLTTDALHRALSAAASSGMTLAPADPKRVLVAVSGGVDSAVAALLEAERGAEVVAVTVKLWADPDTDGTKACCSPEAVLGARAVTHSMGMAHFTLDLEDRFRSRVVSGFVEGYALGRTPNPCVLCNGEVRISAMVDLADRLGATHLVTGHYAGIVDDGEGELLAEGSDANKDQSYMLAALPTGVISRLRFPLAGTSKPEVREIASRHSLSVAKKPESQDLCFLAGSSKRAFLERHGGLQDSDGPVLDSSGAELGRHPGHHHFTVGQRRGLGVAAGRPLYVTATDSATNSVTIGPKEELSAGTVSIADAVMHRDGATVDRVRLRYRSPAVKAKVAATAGRHDLLEIELDEPFDGPAPGQAAVLMSGGTVVGHGTIK